MSKALVVKPISLIIHMQANFIESLKMYILIYIFYEIKSICDFFYHMFLIKIINRIVAFYS